MSPEPLSAETILECLTTREIGRNLIYRHSAISTMEVALEQIESGASHGTVIIAGEQEQGKGRLNRAWSSPPGGVYVSIILYPTQELLPSLTMIASLAVTDCIQEVCGIKADIKWPNDVLINGKKVAGILAQSGKTLYERLYAIVGIGINVNLDVSAQPEITSIATSLSDVTGTQVMLNKVACALINSFEKRYEFLKSGEALWQEWRDRLVTLGQQVSVKSGQDVFQGVAESVNAVGSLQLRQIDGTLKEIPAGDVTLRA